MTTRTRSVVAMVFVVAVAVFATTYSLKAASSTAQAPDPMTALLAEVHALRIAMEQSAIAAAGSAYAGQAQYRGATDRAVCRAARSGPPRIDGGLSRIPKAGRTIAGGREATADRR